MPQNHVRIGLRGKTSGQEVPGEAAPVPLKEGVIKGIKVRSFALKTEDKKSVKAGPAAKRNRKKQPIMTAEAEVFDRATEVIGDKVEAMRWMGTPVRMLDYATPVSLVGSTEGRKAVLIVLERLEHGVL